MKESDDTTLLNPYQSQTPVCPRKLSLKLESDIRGNARHYYNSHDTQAAILSNTKSKNYFYIVYKLSSLIVKI